MDDADIASICAFLSVKIESIVGKRAQIEQCFYESATDMFTVIISRLNDDMHVDSVEKNLRDTYRFTNVQTVVTKDRSPKVFIKFCGGWQLYKNSIEKLIRRERFRDVLLFVLFICMAAITANFFFS